MRDAGASVVPAVSAAEPALVPPRRSTRRLLLTTTAAVLVALAVALVTTLGSDSSTAAVSIVRAAALAVVGVVLVVVDARTRRLPDLLTIPSLAAVLVFDGTVGAVGPAGDPGGLGAPVGHDPLAAAWAALAPGLLGALALGAIYALLAYLGTMGGGDVKLAMLIGAVLVPACGWWSLVAATVAAYVLALPHATIGLIRSRRGDARATHLPFGPYLVAGAAVAWVLSALGALD